MYVAFVSYGCCKSKSGDVAYVAVVSEACCKSMFSSVLDDSEVCLICVFQTHVAFVFIWMLHMFHTYVACVLFGCCVWLQWFSSVFQVCF